MFITAPCFNSVIPQIGKKHFPQFSMYLKEMGFNRTNGTFHFTGNLFQREIVLVTESEYLPLLGVNCSTA